MFPRIAGRIIHHALCHLLGRFKMLLQYLELQIIHVGVINKVKIQQMGVNHIQFRDVSEQILSEVTI